MLIKIYKRIIKINILSFILILFLFSNIYSKQIIEPMPDDNIDINKMTLNSEVDLSRYFGLDIYNDEVATVIDDFRNTYIKPNMSDFEKEIKIIQYLVENINYDYENLLNDTIDNESYTIYGALIKHRAVCAGYASAFDVMCKAVGIESKVITGSAINNSSHAWNQIKLNDEWYNVDVTFEDVIVNNTTNNGYGFKKLRNLYINRTNFEFMKDHMWDIAENAIATEYGPDRVRYYLFNGNDTGSMSLDEYRSILLKRQKPIVERVDNGYKIQFILDSELINIGPKFDDDSNYISDINVISITNYISNSLLKSNDIIYICYNTNQDVSFINREWLENTFVNIKNFAIFDFQLKNTYTNYVSNNQFNLLVIVPDCLKYFG